MATRHLVLAWTLLCSVGCTDSAYVIEVELAPALAERTRAIELSLVAGGCVDGQTPGEPVEGAIQRRVLERDGSRASFSPAEPGVYGVYGLARDAQCAPIAAGCEEYTLEPGGSGTITVSLDAVDGEACGACDDGVCGDGFDAGVRDGGMDGGVRDGGMDGGGMDGGRDAGIPDAGFDAGPPSTLCPIPGALFCDGFEDGGIARWSGSEVSDGGTLQVVNEVNDGGDVYLGGHAAKMRTESQGEVAAVAYAFEPPIMSGPLWIRAFIYLPDQTDLERIGVLYLTDEASKEGIALHVNPKIIGYLQSSTEYDRDAGRPVPFDEWTCIELHVDIAEVGAVELFMNDDPIANWPNVDTRPDGGFVLVAFGLENTNAQSGPAEVYFDEVAISSTRLGCR